LHATFFLLQRRLSWFEVLFYIVVNKRNAFQDCVLIDPGTRLAFVLWKQQTKIEKTGDAIKDKVENAASSLDDASNTMVIKNENRQLQP
jgi:hypothetical protein